MCPDFEKFGFNSLAALLNQSVQKRKMCSFHRLGQVFLVKPNAEIHIIIKFDIQHTPEISQKFLFLWNSKYRQQICGYKV